jgi:hypothetical protein
MKWDLPNGKDSAASATHQYGQSHIKPIMALHDASNAHIVTNLQKVSRMYSGLYLNPIRLFKCKLSRITLQVVLYAQTPE